MQLIKHNLFPTLVGSFKEVLFPSQCEEIISAIDKSKFRRFAALEGNAVTNFTGTIKLHDYLNPELIRLLDQKIHTCINQFTGEYGCTDLEVGNTWISYQYPGSELNEHTHPGSHMSGVLYLKVDENSSPIFFSNPNPFIKFTNTFGEDTIYTEWHHKFTPSVGEMLIFPSWLAHGSKGIKNMSEERIILSFNTSMVQGD